MAEFNFTPFPALQTEGLYLRKITSDDVNDIYSFRSDEEVMRYIPRPLATKPEDVLPVIEMISSGIEKNQSINWGICSKSDNKLIGIIGYVRMNPGNLRAEIGYVLHREHHRKGIMQEALAAVMNFGFREMKLNCIEAIVDPRNHASLSILQKNNFQKEGLLRDYNYLNDIFSDVYILSLLRREYDQKIL